MQKHNTDEKHSSANGVRKKRKYERTTPVGRVRKHLAKGLSVTQFALDRMLPWEGTKHPQLVQAIKGAMSALQHLQVAANHVEKLYDKGWQPPVVTPGSFMVGESVDIVPKHRAKYLEIYDKKVVDNLRVVKLLKTRRLSVQHGNHTPFIVPKSHLCKRRPPSADARV
jgi:hypothetical protein